MKLLCLTILLVIIGCTTSKQTQPVYKQKLSVSFFSKGSGIDYNTREALDNYIDTFDRKEGVSVPVTQRHWGREGEIDYCIDIKSVPLKKQQKFINGARQILGLSQLVTITETDTCRR